MPIRIFFLTLGAFALGTDTFIIGGILPSITSSLATPIYFGGALVSAFAISYALGSPILASVTANHNRRTVLLISLGSFTLANGISALAPSFDWLIVSRVMAGLGGALYLPTALAMAVAMVSANQRGRALAWVTGGLSIAIVVGVPIGTWLSGLSDWRLSFWFVAAVSLLAFCGAWLWIPRVEGTGAGTLGDRLRLLGQRNIGLALLQATLWIAGGFTVYTYISPLLMQMAHMDVTGIGMILLLFGTSSVLGNIIGGYGSDRLGANKVILIALPILALALFSLSWSAASTPGLSINVIVWGIAGGMLIPTQQHRLFDYAPTLATVVFSLNGAVTYLGIGLGSMVGSAVVQSSQLPELGIVAAALVALSLLSVLFSRQAAQSESPDPEQLKP
jgi:DHA1 family inner membrane transport protein